ncbi:hypothetical protein EIN_507980 [Entamoeba invadens IP1]|uniref:Uncharacterized protein n=1 Tax=Entamoeba invadens IP1 TaxID=370355 RepID=A0A0A1UC92_ENTIV|nr:hypothetical protein EIN_507980 [Entamoeba invadens IP1]ELP92857.1 hypothetical protein EIN_507980 [Entamoeba invadens IP1]|eukprot:XP_004259628.1 hypothetical protein EIN_507980 [Entamoeba invadens IP1]
MSRLDVYHMMIVSQYFLCLNDFITLEMVKRKFKNNIEKFQFNPIPINKKTIKYFTHIETLNLWSKEDERFGNYIFDKKNFISHQKVNFYRINIWFEAECPKKCT